MNRNDKNPGSTLLHILFWPFRSYFRIVAVVSVIGLYQYQGMQVDMLATAVRNLELERMRLANQKAGLQVKIDQLTNLNRIEKEAKEKFGLINSGNEINHLVIAPFEDEKSWLKEKEELKLAGVR